MEKLWVATFILVGVFFGIAGGITTGLYLNSFGYGILMGTAIAVGYFGGMVVILEFTE
jgi:hypothetical protein